MKELNYVKVNPEKTSLNLNVEGGVRCLAEEAKCRFCGISRE